MSGQLPRSLFGRLIRWLIGSSTLLLIAALTYSATIRLAPSALMFAVTHRLASLGGVNQIVHAPRADEHQRSVVMPSPDFLYSYCVYDLSHGALRVQASVPADTYWSVSAYDAHTDNYYAIDDRSLPAHRLDLLLIAAQSPLPSPASSGSTADFVVRSPSTRGILLFRTLVDRDARVTELDQARRQASCQSENESSS